MLFSPAKLNLGLRIVGRRSDGYHLIESLFWPLNFGDSIDLEPANRTEIKYAWAPDAPLTRPELFQNEKTLLGQLLEALCQEKNIKPLKITVKKCIPIGGGLGGISSNCGTVLTYLVSKNWLSPEEALSWATRFGADIPFFLDPSPSWVTGIGEKITPLRFSFEPQKKLFFLLLLFPFQVPTPVVFQRYKELRNPFSPQQDFDCHTLKDWELFLKRLTHCQNDLEPIVTEAHGEIKKALNSIRLTDCITGQVSGTGPTCYGIYLSEEKRLKASQEIEKICRDIHCRKVFAETFTSCAVQL